MCPFIMNKPELCKAALSSWMIDDEHCSSEAYDRCPIFLINKSVVSEQKKMTIRNDHHAFSANADP
jgi:hypothetical protein